MKFLGVLAIAFVVMLIFRGLVMTVCTIEGDGLAPQFIMGDRVVVNRWSYGLRTGEKGSLFDYGRICRQEVKKGDFIAFEDSLGQVLICQCTAVPGDTVYQETGDRSQESGKRREETGVLCVVPGLANCADQDYYWVRSVSKNNPIDSRQLGFIPEERIIGRACLVLFSRDPEAPFWKGYRSDRLLLPK
ncbi:MAG: signal peptidase I [Prevotella sp.]|nr:signal peptidase I [Prevotella sp.]